MGIQTTSICRNCHEEFHPHRKGATACSFKCQVAQWHQGLTEIEATECAYCGDPATDEDHIPPRSAVHALQATGIRLLMHTVPSCSECNSAILNRRALWTFAERVSYVADALPVRLASALSCQDWDDDELEELGYSLRQRVEAAVYRKRWAQARCLYAEQTAAWANALDRLGLAGGWTDE